MEGETPSRNYIGRLRGRERKIVLNIFDKRLFRTTIYPLRTELQRYRTLSTPGKEKTEMERQQTNSHKQTYDGIVQSGLRRIVHTFLFASIPPTLSSILAKVNSDESLPVFSHSALHRRGNNAAFVKRDDIIRWRWHTYLRKVKRFRCFGKPVIYTDELWVNMGLSVERAWKDTTVKSALQAVIEGLSSGLKTPTGHGAHFALVHAGNEDDFAQNAALTFLCKNNTADAHDEMTADGYEKWFSE
ncbi:hypothetical protein PR048_029062 [Dryococelus australis]|uniref:Uncharacterized protein n=1 Tax=Dryococelus australis TaxID=614101 RepID=A0ABQ9GCD5_9NEOP|nr:hypothetical protein PR048_029062 [Dryococelus australis]